MNPKHEVKELLVHCFEQVNGPFNDNVCKDKIHRIVDLIIQAARKGLEKTPWEAESASFGCRGIGWIIVRAGKREYHTDVTGQPTILPSYSLAWRRADELNREERP